MAVAGDEENWHVITANCPSGVMKYIYEWIFVVHVR
eukprot:CAMPEP_0185749050 /NCGR_PEP_ID=MMETSP1174-20130828/7796_1 /TAXON_ID=35687 /ORGANISM="Dictyocha speculum, Strain CCMP1381" /LENGTH=35 /DNA_ID= /DNA_START= /DNA_END= /DNA_ORIENTATION=